MTTETPAEPVFGEIATTADGRDITRGFISPIQRLEPQDAVLRARGGGNLAIYDEVLRDEQVKMALEQRQLAVVSCGWEVEPGGGSAIDKKAAAALKANLAAIEWDRITREMLFGVFYGYSIGELLYMRDGAQVVIDEIRVRDRKRFAFDGGMRLRLLTSRDAAVGEALPPAKFWTFVTGATHSDEPYGLGLAHWLYWPALFKRGGLKLWLTFLDKFGQPTVIGRFPRNATAEERAKLLAACAAVRSDSGVIVPEGMQLELLEAARSGTADHATLWDRMNDAIAKVALGQTLTSEAKGGQYKADVQMDVRQQIIKADADLICMSFSRQAARWLTAWNFPDALPPRIWRNVAQRERLNRAVDRDEKLRRIGYRPTLERVRKEYGEGYEPIGYGRTGAPALGLSPAGSGGRRKAAEARFPVTGFRVSGATARFAEAKQRRSCASGVIFRLHRSEAVEFSE